MTDAATRPTGALAAKLSRVMAACAKVPRDGHNQHFNYKFASVGAVLGAVNAALVAENVSATVFPEILSDVPIQTARGGAEHLVTVRTVVTLHDGDSGESLVLCGLGSGQDAGDKAVAKAMSMAIKYAWLLTLAIDTNDDPDADQTKRPTSRQVARPAAPRPPAAATAATAPAAATIAPPTNGHTTKADADSDDADALLDYFSSKPPATELLLDLDPDDLDPAHVGALYEDMVKLAAERGVRPPSTRPSTAAALGTAIGALQRQIKARAAVRETVPLGRS